MDKVILKSSLRFLKNRRLKIIQGEYIIKETGLNLFVINLLFLFLQLFLFVIRTFVFYRSFYLLFNLF
ncbi:hypothetical protein EUGRSUZ_D01852 [Eucalyptus grandis]|uniref:Uncharacterized protein n=1 Tax=Eucalyptus grandis TaxID=71139 RepID=A0A059CGE8_EUCGR|nr:hypothetical protein EUGRSUZ_D01852 [Eucalyptus grandis]